MFFSYNNISITTDLFFGFLFFSYRDTRFASGYCCRLVKYHTKRNIHYSLLFLFVFILSHFVCVFFVSLWETAPTGGGARVVWDSFVGVAKWIRALIRIATLISSLFLL